MAQLFGGTYSKEDLLQHIGHLSQVGGIDLLEAADGPARGVRLLHFRTGSGLVFNVALDRGMDIGRCEYRGMPAGWVPPTQFPSPWLFSEEQGFGWLRNSLGGLMNTCGLVHIGNPDQYDVSHYGFEARNVEVHGVHDRIARAPAKLLHYGERWEGDDCLLEAVGEVRQSHPFGENLQLVRKYAARLGSSSFTITDKVTNCGYTSTRHQLLYHMQIGFPFVVEGGSVLVRSEEKAPGVLAGIVEDPLTASRSIMKPQRNWKLQVFSHHTDEDEDGMAAAAVIQPETAEKRMGFYLRYERENLPVLIQSQFMGQAFYAVGLEPSSNDFTQESREGERLWLEPGESRTYRLELGILDGSEAVEIFLTQNILP